MASARSFARSRARWDPAAQQRLAAHSGGPGALLLCAREHSWAGGLGANAQAPGQAAHVDRLLANSQAGRWPEAYGHHVVSPARLEREGPVSFLTCLLFFYACLIMLLI